MSISNSTSPWVGFRRCFSYKMSRKYPSSPYLQDGLNECFVSIPLNTTLFRTARSWSIGKVGVRYCNDEEERKTERQKKGGDDRVKEFERFKNWTYRRTTVVPSTAADSSVGTVSLATGSGMLLVGCRQGRRCEARASPASSVDAAEAALFCRLSPTLNPSTPLKGTAHNRVMPEAHFCIRHVRQRIDPDYLKKKGRQRKYWGEGGKAQWLPEKHEKKEQKDTMEEHCTEDGQDGRTLNRRWAKIWKDKKK